MTISYVAFYSKNNISPVTQDISDLNKHFQRRESLFRSLGLAPLLIEGRKILEFGPGSGHNAIYMASLSPSLYELVDGNPKGVQETRERLAPFRNSQIQVHHRLFDEFESDIAFDLVWAEGCIPHQNNPLSLLRKISGFVRSGGILCITMANGVSYLSETMRRLFRDRFFNQQSEDIFEQARQLTPYLQPHLQNLRGMSRPVEDWILDNIVQPLQHRRLLCLPEVIECLADRFDVYGSSPKFLTDWRWYKEIVGEEQRFNEKALESYYGTNLNLLDYRFESPQHSHEFGKKLEELGSQSWDLMCKIEKGDESGWQDFFTLMQEVLVHIESQAPHTAEAIQEAVNLLQGDRLDQELHHFPKWWGRGQQFVSLIRRND